MNQTKLKLDYKFQGHDDEINEIDCIYTDSPLFFKINSKVFLSKKKQILFRIKHNTDTSEWSNSFMVDAVGNNGTITSKSKDKQNGKIYEIGVSIKLSSNGLTKIIKLTPYYLLVNNTNVRVIALNKRKLF